MSKNVYLPTRKSEIFYYVKIKIILKVVNYRYNELYIVVYKLYV